MNQPPKPKSTPRVDKLRAARLALGLKRRDVYAHDDDWPQIKALEQKLAQKRERK